jgi:hypothetical protein
MNGFSADLKSFNRSIFNCQTFSFPAVPAVPAVPAMLEAGSWKQEAGSWKLEAGNRKLETGNWMTGAKTCLPLFKTEKGGHFYIPNRISSLREKKRVFLCEERDH